MENKEKILQVLAALESLPVKGYEHVTTMAGCMQVLREVANSLSVEKAEKAAKK